GLRHRRCRDLRGGTPSRRRASPDRNRSRGRRGHVLPAIRPRGVQRGVACTAGGRRRHAVRVRRLPPVTAYIGSSGGSYATWRPAFYPAGTRTEEFLGLYAARLSAVELNATGYRLPTAEQFGRWAEQVPDGFRFAVKAPRLALRRPEVVRERVLALGDRLGCVRVVVEGARDAALLERLH